MAAYRQMTIAVTGSGKMANTTMMFPNTVREFMEQHKMVDTEQIYSNGIEYVPIFRMEQWFDYIEALPAQPEIIRCKDCKHYNADFECLIEGYGIERDKDWFCADAERRTDE